METILLSICLQHGKMIEDSRLAQREEGVEVVHVARMVGSTVSRPVVVQKVGGDVGVKTAGEVEVVKKEDGGFGIKSCGRPRLAKTINLC